jgi:ribonuclease HI
VPTDAQILAAVAEAETFSRTLEKHPHLNRHQIADCLRRAAGESPAPEPTPAPRAVRSPTPGRAQADLQRVKIYSDGAARGNPGPAGAGAVILASDGTTVARLGRFLGEATNNYAEYHGLLLGLQRAVELGASEVQVYADSQLMIRQLGGQYRVRNAGLRPLFDEALRLLRTFRKYDLHHIPREQNTAADEMSNRAIDEKM